MKKNKILIISLGILFMNKISIVNALDNKCYFPGSNNQIIRLNRLFTDELDILDPVIIYESNCDVIRLLGIECFAENFLIKVCMEKNNSHIFYKIGSNDEDGNINGVKVSKQIDLKNIDIENIKNLIIEKSLYNMESFSNAGATTRDGGLWILEINIDGNYHIIKRNVTSEGELFELYELFLQLLDEPSPFNN